MRPNFHPCLVNGPFSDPCLYINFIHANRAVAFDLGDINRLSAGHILKISHVFISHTHIDHFIGFDQLLRLALGREKTVHLFGPENFLANLEGKLAAYNWNLIENYQESLHILATEISAEKMVTKAYACRDRFACPGSLSKQPFSNIILEEQGFTVFTEILDHGIPCLAFRLEEKFHINIKKNSLTELGLPTGPWLKKFKAALFEGLPADTPIFVPVQNGCNDYRLDFLTDHICVITPGQAITYITDVAYTSENIEKIISFAENSDCLFIEAHFLEKDKSIAAEKGHLTARQAGELAGRAGAKRMTTFHYSPRYTDTPELLEKEAAEAYQLHF